MGVKENNEEFELYEPREDSHLLERCVEQYAFGDVLDICTGTGIQAIAAARNEKVKSVTAVDINPICTKVTLESAIAQGFPITVITGDMFKGVEGKYDIITINPPYLPEDEKIKDIALDGGKEGYEFIERFLSEAKNYLKDGGIILLLFSSLTNKNKVEGIIEKEHFEYKEIDKMELDFETLYVYLLK